MDRNDSSRREAERLAAAALAAASFAAKTLSKRLAADARRPAPPPPASERSGGFGDELSGLVGMATRLLGGEEPPRPDDRRSGHHIANGSDECCMCPVCRVISAVRDPSPEFSERVASGASDLASGVATVMRAFSGAASRFGRPGPATRPATRPRRARA